MQKQLSKEVKEMKVFLEFLETTRRVDLIDRYKPDSQCAHVLNLFSATATDDHQETLAHLFHVNNQYKLVRQHSLSCERCQIALDSILVFVGFHARKVFPEKISKILAREYNHEGKKETYIIKLPAPNGGNFSPLNGRLVYATPKSIDESLFDFNARIIGPLDLEGISRPRTREKTIISGGRTKLRYLQADMHHSNSESMQTTYLSIRSVNRL